MSLRGEGLLNMTLSVNRKINSNFAQNKENDLMSCFITSAFKTNCRDCGHTGFDVIYDRRLKSRVPICTKCDGDPKMYRVAYVINTLEGKKKRFRTRNNLGERLDSAVKATNFLNYVREKIEEEGEFFDVRSVGTKKEREELLLVNLYKDYLLTREADLDNEEISPGGLKKINRYFNNYIVPIFGRCEVKRINYNFVFKTLEKTRMVSDARKNISLDMKNQIVSALLPFLKYCSREGIISGVPELPKYKTKTKFKKEDFYNFEEIKLILKNITNKKAKLGLILCSVFAKRRCEIECLKDTDFNFKKSTITFNKHRSDGGKEFGSRVIPGLKSSPEAEVTYKMEPELCMLVREYIADNNIKDEFLLRGRNGKMVGKNFLLNHWSEAVKKLMNERDEDGNQLISKYCDVHRGTRSSVLTEHANNGASNSSLAELYAGDIRTLMKFYVRKNKQKTDDLDLGATLVQLSEITSKNGHKIRQLA